MQVNPVLEALGATAITVLHSRVRAMRDAGRELIDFSIGDPREPTPGFVKEALHEAVPDVSQYPTTTGLPELREAIAGYLAGDSGSRSTRRHRSYPPRAQRRRCSRLRSPSSTGTTRPQPWCTRHPVIRSTSAAPGSPEPVSIPSCSKATSS